jgi:hypothetical protein
MIHYLIINKTNEIKNEIAHECETDKKKQCKVREYIKERRTGKE